jgi:hypothetical protein
LNITPFTNFYHEALKHSKELKNSKLRLAINDTISGKWYQVEDKRKEVEKIR